jgi:hypothetical protein
MLLWFVPMYAQHAVSITNLLKGSPAKKDTVQWTPEALKDFESLKRLLQSQVSLCIPDP